MLCSICVNTHKRPKLLAKLLDSLVHQKLTAAMTIEIIVVDNDPAGSGRTIVEQYLCDYPTPIEYHHEPIKNISLARNKAVSQAKGDYILFIDDDEEASPFWVQTMVTAVKTYRADAAFGRVVSIFNDEAPEWIKKIYIYHRPCHPTGTPTYSGRTSNAIVKASWLYAEAGPFDQALGLTGGEDSNLFHRLLLKGANFIACYEGVVTEFMPPDRTQPAWLRNRARRTGIIYAQRTVALSKNQLITKLYIAAKAIPQLVLSYMLKCLSFSDPYRHLHWELKTAAYTGHIMALLGKQMVGY